MTKIIFDQSTATRADMMRSERLIPAGEGLLCGEATYATDSSEWQCTRDKGHRGVHVAHYTDDANGGRDSVGLAWQDV